MINKSMLVVLLVFCIHMHIDCFKFRDSDLIPERFLRRSNQYDNDDDLLLSNHQRSLYPDLIDSESAQYRKALDAIAAEALLASAAANQQRTKYSEELHLDDFITNDEDEDEDQDFENDDNDDDIKIDPKDEETESHSSLLAGHQYVSGGAGEGKQHLQPDGNVANKEEIKTDEDLPAYCDPPNPCPVGYEGDDCDARPYAQFTAEYSKVYQEQQNCMCDDDHNDCQRSAKTKSADKISEMMHMSNIDKFSPVVAKKSPRVRREIRVKAGKKNPYTQGKAIKIHVAKKSNANNQ